MTRERPQGPRLPTEPWEGVVNVDPTPDTAQTRPFRPSWWLPGAHLQTLAGNLFRRQPPISCVSVRLDTPDGDFLDLDVGPDPGPEAPVVLILHGLEGSSRRNYVRATVAALFRKGLRAVGMNFRGCSGEPNRTARFYHSGETGDLGLVVTYLSERFPNRRLGAVGWSLGGNVLLKFLGEEADSNRERVRAAVTVSVPFDLSAGARKIERGFWGRVYTLYFLVKLRRKILQKRGLLHEMIDVDEASRAPTIRLFDELATAPIHGFRSAEDYYARSSSNGFLDRIRIPTLLIQARNDPFLPEDRLPERAARENPMLVPRFTDGGGHVGFVEGPPWAPSFWAEDEAARFLAHHLTPP